MTTTTLDEVLRKRGKEKLRAELEAMFKPTFDAACQVDTIRVLDSHGQWMYAGKMGETIPENRTALTAYGALKFAFDALFKYRLEKAEQAEVDAFLRNVDNLRDSVDELYAGLPR